MPDERKLDQMGRALKKQRDELSEIIDKIEEMKAESSGKTPRKRKSSSGRKK